MAGKFATPKKKRSAAPIVAIAAVLILAGLVTAAWVLSHKAPMPVQAAATLPPETIPETIAETVPETTVLETTLPQPEHPVATATVGAMGDILMHKPIVDQSVTADGYDFSHIFRYIREDIGKLDYAVANLETTLCAGKAYTGYPKFNSPDQIAVDLKDAGFDMLLTANNHSYDTSIEGYLRTLEVTRGLGFDTIGTYSDSSEAHYIIKDINGIRLGMICYTYETNDGTGSHPALNGNQMYDADYSMINCFSQKNLPAFYKEVKKYLKQMRKEGAEATVLFIHWGVEYITTAKDWQKEMAQQLCDMGVDVIVGGHPHVLEPVSLLESTVDPGHKTVCIYSLGNAVSNYRIETSKNPAAAGYTEDGALFTMTFEKYSDGNVYLLDVDVLPTWVYLTTDGAHARWPILPLNEKDKDRWQQMYDLPDGLMSRVQKSFDRTQSIVSEGTALCREYLAQQKQARDQHYAETARQ